MDLGDRLELLAGGARYDASCASSGAGKSPRSGPGEGSRLGAAVPAGVCHSWTGDGRCVSLLKLLYSNVCRFDCAYCVNRASNEISRASFSPEELVRLTISFYKRNYIEGLFLSSGIFADPDIVMGRLTEVARRLREEEGFGGYIHLKAIPGAGEAALWRAGLYADRLSANIELATGTSLARLAPDKSGTEILGAMRYIKETEAECREDSSRLRSTPVFAPAGQSTQLIVGASPEADGELLRLSEGLYGRYGLRRVYYSAYVPVLTDPRLPRAAPPLLREHRLYQADWLLRFYGFRATEILEASGSSLAMDLDPKTAWALGHPNIFPVELSRADYGEILRVPGIGLVGATRILAARRAGRLRLEDLRRMGIVLKRARFFLSLYGQRLAEEADPALLRPLLADRPELAGGQGPSRAQDAAARPGTRGAAALLAPAQLELDFSEAAP